MPNLAQKVADCARRPELVIAHTTRFCKEKVIFNLVKYVDDQAEL